MTSQNSAICFAKVSLTESSIYLKSKTHADVAKLVDARDLKSLGLGHAGSIPAVRTNNKHMIFNTDLIHCSEIREQVNLGKVPTVRA